MGNHPSATARPGTHSPLQHHKKSVFTKPLPPTTPPNSTHPPAYAQDDGYITSQHHRANISVVIDEDNVNELIRSYRSPTSPLKLRLGIAEEIESSAASFIQPLDGDMNDIRAIQVKQSGKKQFVGLLHRDSSKSTSRRNSGSVLRVSVSDHDIHYIAAMDHHHHHNNSNVGSKRVDSDVSTDGDLHSHTCSTYIVSDHGTLIAGEFEINSNGIQVSQAAYTASVSSKRQNKHELSDWLSKQRANHQNSPKTPKLNLLSPTLSYKSAHASADSHATNHRSPFSAPVLQKSASDASIATTPIKLVQHTAVAATDVTSAHLSISPLSMQPTMTPVSHNTVASAQSDITPTHHTQSEAIDTTPFSLTLRESDLIILETIGRGQNGSVLKAVHKPTLTRVALKKMSISDPSHQHQLQHELHTMVTLADSSYLVSFLGAYADTGNITLALEYMDCGSLTSFVKQNGALGVHRQCIIQHIVKHTLHGLSYLHSSHTVHRDIKPDNILLNHSAHVKITDFGLATELSNLTAHTDTYVGTLAYLAPERLLTQQYSYSSDIWSFGLTLVYMCTGSIPPQFNDYWQLLNMLTTYDQLPMTLLNVQDGWSAELIDFVSQCLCYKPEQRATADQLLQHPFVTTAQFDGDGEVAQRPEWRYSLPRNASDIDVLLNVLIDQECALDAQRLSQLVEEYGMSAEVVQQRFEQLTINQEQQQLLLSTVAQAVV